jgi:hypothetical protein
VFRAPQRIRHDQPATRLGQPLAVPAQAAEPVTPWLKERWRAPQGRSRVLIIRLGVVLTVAGRLALDSILAHVGAGLRGSGIGHSRWCGDRRRGSPCRQKRCDVTHFDSHCKTPFRMVRPIHGLVLPEVLRANPVVAADTHKRFPPAGFGPLSVGLTSAAGPGAPVMIVCSRFRTSWCKTGRDIPLYS